MVSMKRFPGLLLIILVVCLRTALTGQNRSIRSLRIDSDKFHIAILGDRTGAGPDSWKVFDRAVREVNQLNPDFTIMIGDIIEGAGANRVKLRIQWDEARSHLDSVQTPLVLIPGNHDITNRESYNYWKEQIGKTYDAFSYRGCRFILINTEEGRGTDQAGLGDGQIAFVKQEIDGAKDQPIFLIMHQPMWIVESGLGEQWKTIEGWLGNRNYTVIAGHLHVLAGKRDRNHLFLIQGPTGGEMRMERNPALGFFHHFTWMTVEGGIPSVAFIEPGRIYPEKTALQAYERYMQGMMLMGK
jgi:3',5'-cyclic AMP phosphodiesterase CpdA